MNEKAIDWLVSKNANRKASCNFLLGLLAAAEDEAVKLGFGELSSRLSDLCIEARYAVLDDLLDTSAASMLLSRDNLRLEKLERLGG